MEWKRKIIRQSPNVATMLLPHELNYLAEKMIRIIPITKNTIRIEVDREDKKPEQKLFWVRKLYKRGNLYYFVFPKPEFNYLIGKEATLEALDEETFVLRVDSEEQVCPFCGAKLYFESQEVRKDGS